MFSRTSQPLGVISTYFRLPQQPSDDVLQMTDLYARQAAEMIESKQSEVARGKYQQELQELTTRLIEAQEIQSKHLARELHDVFSQRLAAIGMELTRLGETALQSSQTLGGPLLKLTEEIGRLAHDIHGIARQIHPAILDDLGLSAAIRSECLAFREQYGMPVEFTSDNMSRDIPEDVALCLYRIVQESLRNIAKHAGMARVSVRLRARPGELVLAIDDVGHGFDPESIKGKRGLGLVSMEERLRIVGGTLSIRSQQGNGTHVEAKVPSAP
jgi:signal transduction histidine kinase